MLSYNSRCNVSARTKRCLLFPVSLHANEGNFEAGIERVPDQTPLRVSAKFPLVQKYQYFFAKSGDSGKFVLRKRTRFFIGAPGLHQAPFGSREMLDQLPILAPRNGIMLGSAVNVPARVNVRMPAPAPTNEIPEPWLRWRHSELNFDVTESINNWLKESSAETENGQRRRP